MKIVGLTGGMASGKSTAAGMLSALGAVTHSADEDARAVLAPGSPALAAVFAAFPGVRRSDGSLDRAALAARIFADPAEKARLEAITHPAILARMRAVVAAARASGAGGVLVYEVPLLYERNLAPLFDTVIAVLASPALQAERLQAREAAAGRPALTADAIRERLAAQLPPEEKARRADYIVRTDVSVPETEAQVRQIWQTLQKS